MKTHLSALIVGVFGVLLFLPSAALAQAEDLASDPAAPPPMKVSQPGAIEPVVIPDSDSSVSSEQDESIYVVQRRLYSKSGKLELTPMFFTSLNNKFVGHFGAALGVAYHLRENLALELVSSIPYAMKSFYSALVYDVYSQAGLGPDYVEEKVMTYFGSANLDFSAFYGKMEFYGQLVDFDFYLTAGFGLATTLETCKPYSGDPQDAPEESLNCGADKEQLGFGMRKPLEASDRYKLTGNLGGGMRFFFLDNVGLRLEIRDVVYADRTKYGRVGVETNIRSHVLFTVGLSFLLQ